jgi:hypothetical protein
VKGGYTNKTKMKILTIVLMVAIMLSAFAIPLMAAENKEACNTDKDCWDKHYNCYYKCTEEKCGPITSLLIALPKYPNCIVESPVDPALEAEAAADDDATLSHGEIAWTRIQSWFIFNQEKKAELELKLASLRLIQARIAAKNNNSEAMEKSIDAHENAINRVQERMSKVNRTSEKFRGLERAIQVHELKIERLNEKLTNVNLTAEQRTRIENKIAKVQNVTSHLRDVEEKITQKIAEKIANKPNKSAESSEAD